MPAATPPAAHGRLVELELKNFKSYAGTQSIGPFRKFTAIIGPNGAGKSNLMDAISFVLGVRTNQLRGQQLRDLIFRTEGEGHVDGRDAHVKIVYAKTDPDVDENPELVTFTRKISAEGSSQYKLNNRNVTWEAYSKGLADIGINVKSRRFLVFQGDVENIAGMKPIELTKYFEKVSGSADLKGDYDEALAAKTASEENYIFHFQKKKSMAAEKRQVKDQQDEASKFQELQDATKEKQMQQCLLSLYHVEASIKTAEADFEEGAATLEAKEAEKEKVETELKEVKKQQSKLQRAEILGNKELASMEKKLGKQAPAEVELQQSMERLTKKSAKNQKQQSKLRNEVAKHDALLTELRGQHADLKRTRDDFEQDVLQQAGSKVQLSTDQISEYHRKKEEAGAATSELQQQLDQANRKLQAERNKKERNDGDKKDAENKLSQCEAKRDSSLEHQESVSKRISDIENEAARNRTELKRIVDANADRLEKEKDANQRLDESNKKLQEAKADRRATERDRKLGDAVEAMQRHYTGVHGRIIDLCKPSQKKYYMAVTVAMGRHTDAVVVDSEATALECVQYLKEQRLASATFIPLDTIQVKPIDETARRLGGSTKLVLDVISYDPKYEKALLYAVGNAIVIDTLDEARKVAYNQPREKRRKTVTLDGTIIHKAGLMTGGNSGDRGGLEAKAQRWDQKDYEALKRKRNVAINELSELEKSRVDPGREEELKAEISGQDRLLKLTKKDLALSEDKCAKVEGEIAKLTAAAKKARPAFKKVEAAVVKLEADVARIGKQVGEKEEEIFAGFSEEIGVENFRHYEETMLKTQQAHISKRLELSSQITKVVNQVTYEENRNPGEPLDRIEAALKSDAKELTAKGKKSDALAKTREEMTASMDAKRAEVAAVNEQSEALGGTVKELSKQVKDWAKQCTTLGKSLMTYKEANEVLCVQRHETFTRCTLETIRLPRAAPTSPAGGKKKRNRAAAAAEEGQPEPVSTSMEPVEAGSEKEKELWATEKELSESLDFSSVAETYDDGGGAKNYDALVSEAVRDPHSMDYNPTRWP